MKIVSLNIGLPRDVVWHGHTVTTGIFKSPVEGSVTARKLNLDGDRQADLSVHGGEYKAVYVYPFEHYPYWKKKLPGRDLPPGTFGENLTTEGLLETQVHIGDRFAIGKTDSAGLPRAAENDAKGIPAGSAIAETDNSNSPTTAKNGAKGTLAGHAEFTVTQPRLPCYKLGVRFEADDMVKKFLASRRVGFYFAVTKEGPVAAGDEITLLSRDPNAITISDFLELYLTKSWTAADITQIHRLFELPSLPDDWKSYFDGRLQDTRP
jgi:MOSC domain-containing protein YiiM